MAKKLSIEDIKKEAFNNYNFTLLSDVYVNNHTKMEWIDNKTGITFTRRWRDIKYGQTTPGNPNERLKLEDIKKEALDKYNLTLITNKYTNNRVSMEWIDNTTGIKFSRSWRHIKRGQVSPRNVNDYEYDKNKIESYKGLGYKYNQTEGQYLSQSRLSNGRRLFILEHPSLPQPWVTTIDHFYTCAETHLNNSGMSYGEQVIYSILENNDIEFDYQYTVTIHDRIHKFDFFLPNYNLFIEYDGRQHFDSIDSWGGEAALEDRKNRDKEKDHYVSDIGANIFRIPYTISDAKDILSSLSGRLDVELSIGKLWNYQPSIKDIAIYYDTHSIRDTIDKYNVVRSTILKYYKRVYGTSKTKRKDIS